MTGRDDGYLSLVFEYAVRAQEWRTVNVGCPSGFKNYTGNAFSELALDVEKT